MLKFRQIEVFKVLMEVGTVTGAAGRLGISQPAVSKVLASMERSTNLTLFERLRGRLIPTPDARSLYRQVHRSFVGLDDLSRFHH